MTAAAIDLSGHNSRAFGMDEPRKTKPPKLTPEQEMEFAKLAEKAATLLAALFKTARKRITGKRQGDEALVIRRALFRYLKGRDCPVKLMARIFDLDRGQPGADADAMEAWEARNSVLDEDMENIADGLDRFLCVKPKRFVRLCVSEMEADRAAAKAVKTVHDAVERIVAPAAPQKTYAKATEKLVAKGQADRQRAAYENQKRIHLRVIEEGLKPGATKEQKRDAQKAADALEALGREMKRAKS